MSSSSTVFALIAAPWLLFFLVWTGSIVYEAITGKVKKVEKREPMAVLILTRVFLYVPIILVFANIGIQKQYPLGLQYLPDTSSVVYTGFVISMVGILFSVWGRMALGSNWSADAELKSGQSLVTSGPYAIVRNPIYSGITLGMAGSAIALGNVSGIIAVGFIVVFSFLRITYEERMMKEKFGIEWEKYVKSVKRFIPWVW